MSNQQGAQPQRAGEFVLTENQQELLKRWSALMARVRIDKELRHRLTDAPAVVLKEQGIPMPEGVDIRVVENTDRVVHLSLPAMSPDGELTAGQLDGVVGGTLIELGVDMVQAAIEIIIGPPEPKKLTGRYTT